MVDHKAIQIAFNNVTKIYPGSENPAVEQISFNVPAGSLVVILGPSGCGKTTLLKTVNRLVEPTSGSIMLGDKEIHDLPITELRCRIGYVIQQVGLFPHMTNYENVAVVPKLMGWDKKKIDQRIHELLETVGLPDPYLNRYPRQISGGEQQRIGLMRAMAGNPSIMLMDEPFASIDAINRNALQKELLRIQNQVNKTILFVTHDVEEAFRLADIIVVMRAGKKTQYGTPLEIITKPKNAFVEELVGTKDMLRKLSLIRVKSILNGKKREKKTQMIGQHKLRDTSAVHMDENLRTALSEFLKIDQEAINVVNDEDIIIGEIKFPDFRNALVEKD